MYVYIYIYIYLNYQGKPLITSGLINFMAYQRAACIRQAIVGTQHMQRTLQQEPGGTTCRTLLV